MSGYSPHDFGNWCDELVPLTRKLKPAKGDGLAAFFGELWDLPFPMSVLVDLGRALMRKYPAELNLKLTSDALLLNQYLKQNSGGHAPAQGRGDKRGNNDNNIINNNNNKRAKQEGRGGGGVRTHRAVTRRTGRREAFGQLLLLPRRTQRRRVQLRKLQRRVHQGPHVLVVRR